MVTLIGKDYRKIACSAFLFLLLITLWQLPNPEGLSLQGWHLFLIFLCTILGLMMNPAPMGAITLVALALCVLTKTMTIQQALSGFSNTIVWLITCAFLIARSIIKTGLGSRAAYYLIAKLGRSTIGIGYAITLTELILAPAIPSAVARAGIISPLIKSIIQNYANEDHGKSHKNLAQTLTMIGVFANVIACSMFITGTAANPIAVKIAASYGLHIGWGDWFIAAVVPSLVSMSLLPLIFYVICKPEKLNSDQIVKSAVSALRDMGTLKWQEKILIFVLGLMITMWSLDTKIGIHPVTTAISGLCLLIATGIIRWDEVTTEKSAWDTFIWFSVLLTVADMLTENGVTSYISMWLKSSVSQYGLIMQIVLLSTVFFLMHYLFASISAYLTVLYGPFLGAFISLGLPALPSAFALAFMAILSSTLTHYGISSAIVYFQMGYFSTSRWWRISGISTLINVMIWLLSTAVWWKYLGWI